MHLTHSGVVLTAACEEDHICGPESIITRSTGSAGIALNFTDVMQHLTRVLLQEYHPVGRHWEGGGRSSSCTPSIIIWLQVFQQKRGTWDEYMQAQNASLRAAASRGWVRQGWEILQRRGDFRRCCRGTHRETEAELWRSVETRRNRDCRLSMNIPYRYHIVAFELAAGTCAWDKN